MKYFFYTENKDFDNAQLLNLEDSSKTTLVTMYDKNKDGKIDLYASFPVVSFGLFNFEMYDNATLLEMDKNGDGKIDYILKDLNKDAIFDTVLKDLNGDGVFDVKESYFLFLKFEERLGNLVQTFN